MDEINVILISSVRPEKSFSAAVLMYRHLVNRSGIPATYLEIGNRIEEDDVTYPDDDLMLVDGGRSYAHKNREPYD